MQQPQSLESQKTFYNRLKKNQLIFKEITADYGMFDEM